MGRREQIIEAAIKVFAERGYERATNALIAQEAAISPGLIYWYFQSKRDLLIETVRSRALPMFERMRSSLNDSPPREALQQLAETYLSLFQAGEHVRLFRMVFREMGKFPELDALFQELPRPLVDMLAAYIDKQAQSGVFRPIEGRVAAQAFMGALFSFVVRYSIFEPTVGPLPLDGVAGSVVSIFLEGMERGK